MQSTVPEKKNSYLLPLILVTSLFFLWGLAYGLLDVLNKHFQESLHVSKTRSTLLQAAYFGAYFLIALPAGLFINKFGYKKGIIAGLLLYALGALFFYPATQDANFNFFLLALFIIASGLACLETAANPYITVLGKPETSAFRLNLSQCFNGVGSFIGPIIAANVFFTDKNNNNIDSVKFVYLVIAGIVLLVAAFFIKTTLPEIKESTLVSEATQDTKPLFRHRNFVNAVIAQFFYVAAQVGVAALFINYCTEAGKNIDNAKASYLLSVSLFLFTLGRFAGTALMKKIEANKLLLIYSIINIFLCFAVIGGKGWLSVYSLMAVFFFESIMFPTIFALGVKDLGHHTKKGASFIIMSIVGGALVPYIMGMLSEQSTARAYVVPLICFIVVAWYGWKGFKVKK
ncbi:MAG TPA: sugar MFS transporter [Chitinophagaceae bacterium]|nr:sugar MFS transporter [Chitinophagaceae bacterium]